jgi:hypothetical protein
MHLPYVNNVNVILLQIECSANSQCIIKQDCSLLLASIINVSIQKTYIFINASDCLPVTYNKENVSRNTKPNVLQLVFFSQISLFMFFSRL